MTILHLAPDVVAVLGPTWRAFCPIGFGITKLQHLESGARRLPRIHVRTAVVPCAYKPVQRLWNTPIIGVRPRKWEDNATQEIGRRAELSQLVDLLPGLDGNASGES